jgi:hypothetical protein
VDAIHEQILNLSFSHFASCPVTPDTIRDFISRSKGFYPEYKIDEKQLFNSLEALHSVTITEEIKILDDKVDHEEWFNPDTNLAMKRDFEWHFWAHYRDYLIHRKKWPAQVVNSLDRFSSMLLCRMEDPLRSGSWDRRGMVVGNVQSGKTANYTALITKATDAGYKLFVIMAGVHNSLRSQTQGRLNEEFLGYDLDVVQKITGQERRVGVRLMFRNHGVINTLTSSADKGDFKTIVARQAGIIPSMTGDPIILIVKKNVTILKNLIAWATSLGDTNKGGRRIVREIPFLLIDDECDFASVNTKKPERDENNNIIEEWDPAKTNMLIRTLLSSFEKSVYIGYTATPFANIFIHKDDPHPIYGDDLFPKHFLISLPQPSNYVGPEEVFGLKGDKYTGIEASEPLPLVRVVQDSAAVIPGNHKPQHNITGLPESLTESLKAFILVCAARRIRATGTPHNSMLIHVTRFTKVQGQVKELLEDELRILTARIMSSTDPMDDLRILWEEDFAPTSVEMENKGFKEAQVHDWERIRAELYDAVRNVKIRGINGEIGDTLDYRTAENSTRTRINNGETVPWHERGASLIAIGGDKLSRGLTLDGLSISYYLRAARMYDTLMQMGRWFGYRSGYNDLCRIYTSDELIEWYRHIALASRELRNDFDYMEAIGSKPEKFGLKVRNHPGRLAITSAGKARATERLEISFSGQFPKTVVFDPRMSKNNLESLETLIKRIGREPDRVVDPKKPRFHWENVEAYYITDFLRSYRTQDIASKVVDPGRIADYIEKQNVRNELINWHVVVVSKPEEQKMLHKVNVAGYGIGCVLRKAILPVEKEKISIGVLTNPDDEFLDLTDVELELAREFDRQRNKQVAAVERPSTVAIRKYRPKARALMLIYLPAFSGGDKTYGLDGNEVVGFAISFPESDTAEPIEYVVNSVYAAEENA